MIETWIRALLDIVIMLCLLTGTFFIFSSSVGIIRFPDIYTRLHTATKASTLGVSGIMIGAFIFMYVEHGIVSGKLILGIIFVLLTAPVSGHMLSRSAHRTGIKPWNNKYVKDDLAEAAKKETGNN